MKTISPILKQKKLVALFGEYCLLKCKSFSQNSITNKYKANVFLSASYSFKTLREIRIFLKNARNVGLISVTMLQPCLRILEHFIYRDSYFNPNMSEEEYLQYFFKLTKHYKINTIKNYIASLNVFLKFLSSRGYIVRDIAKIKMNFLREKILPSFLDDKEYFLFLQEVQKMREDSLYSLKTKLVILLVYYTGIRTREVAYITLSDITENNNQYIIKIKGKCSMERIVSIKKHYIESVYKKYTQAREKRKSIYLFQLRNTNTPPRLNINLKPILKSIDCVQYRGNKLHLLRHSFASFVYRKSKDILLTQKILGHTNISSTQVYIHLNNNLYEQVASFF